MPKNPATPSPSRLVGALPKIGIRPTIDGRRRGVRESLEKQVMDLARATAALIEQEVRHSSGERVQCVIADACIGGVREAAECAAKFDAEGASVSLTVTPCWCYGSETMDMDPLRPKAIFGFNGTERPGAVYLAAVMAAHAQKGLPAFGIYGRDVQDAGDESIPADVKAKILRFCRAGLAVATMRGKSYLSLGGTSMGIAGSVVDPSFFESWLGMRVEAVDMSEFVRRLEEGIFDQAEYSRAIAWVKANCREGKDWNAPEQVRSRAQLDREWEVSVKMALIARDLMVGNPALAAKGFEEEAMGRNALCAGFQGQRHWTDHFPNGDFMEAILCSSFDWNGIRAPFVLATENDSLNGACMMFGKLLTGTAQVFSDVRTYWSAAAVERVAGHALGGVAAGGLLHLKNSGPTALDATGRQSRGGKPVMKPFWEITPAEVEDCLKHTRWHPSITEYFRGGGWSTSFLTPGGMPLTMSRINLVKGLGPALQIAEGWSHKLPEKVHRVLDERTNATWPTTWFAPRCTGAGVWTDAYSVMNAWGANHGAICYGHVGADLITLAALLRIPVFMHNVPEGDVFRPGTWNAFGTADPEGADFRACQALGPLY
ncbi:MAG: L-fucose isomerase [Planctomycetes bacterium]|nr:L-fucose isomerase [Planctomycetota bacterium]